MGDVLPHPAVDDAESALALGLLDTEQLEALARGIRDHSFGRRVTFSPKVFIPLTMLCRDQCGYCTFAQPPARLDAAFLTPDEVLQLARRGARMGCHEALFTLGERPELRYPAAAQWLEDHGYATTVDYLTAMCELVATETGLLPHANGGALHRAELEQLKRWSPSQGMMVESLRTDLDAHRNAPDKDPARRLATLEHAGELRIPFTSGILVGIGETEPDRIEALLAIADSHRRWGHIQEVIVQNFLPKAGTAMWRHDPCPDEAFRRAIALARVILPPDVHLQAPPNLSDDFGRLLDSGIDDWGGVSPVTADHVNPERPWPDLDLLRDATESRGFTLAPRLTIYPEYARTASGLLPRRWPSGGTNTAALSDWIHPDLRFTVLDRSDADGFGRDDPGAQFPERTEFLAEQNVGDGAEVVIIGDRSTQWYSGAPVDPPDLISDDRPIGGAVGEVLDGVAAGQEVGLDEIVSLFQARGPEVAAIARSADQLRAETVGDDVTYVVNRNINYTNVCTFKCRFCGFSKGPLSLNLRGTPYLLTLEEMQDRVREAHERGATEVCLQGGIHPDFDGDYYIDVARAVKEAAPEIHVHGFTALEVTEGARRLGEPLADYLRRAMDAGLRSLPGTAAEILSDDARQILCPDKITTGQWIEAHEVAHSVGLRSNVTMMFGAIEHPYHWAKHLVATRELQARTGGFTEFVGLPFVHMASPLYLQRRARRGPTFRENLLIHAVARIAYRGHIDNIQSGWVKIGLDSVRQLLQAGCNDIGGTLMDENISRAAGATHGTELTPDDFRRALAPLGRQLVERTTTYGRVHRDESTGAVLSTT